MRADCNKCLNSGFNCKIYGTSLPVAIRFCRQDKYEHYLTRELILRKGEENETPKEESKTESKSEGNSEK